MEKQVDVTVQPCRRVRWLICDNGMCVAEGTARGGSDTNAVDWEEERPPAEYEGLVRHAIARTLNQSRSIVAPGD